MKLFAWAAFAGAVIAGAALAAGSSGLVQTAVVLAALTILTIDIVKDRTPNQAAVIVAVALPSLIVGMNGKLAASIKAGLSWLWNQVQGPAGEWVGTTSALGVAVAAITVSFLISRRAMAPSGGRGMSHRG